MTDAWTLEYSGFDPKQEGLREALCTLGNGVFATRGAAEEHSADGVHYPGTYVAGGYNALTSEIAGRLVLNEDLVNFTNWLPLSFRAADGDWLALAATEVLEYRQTLHLDRGLLARTLRFRDASGRTTRLQTERLVHVGMPELAALRWTITAEDWSGDVVIRSGLDGSVSNGNVTRYRQLSHHHLAPLASGAVSPEGIFVVVQTTASRFEVAVAARTRVFESGTAPRAERRIVQADPQRIEEQLHLRLERDRPLEVEKVVALHSAADRGISEPGAASRMALLAAPDFEALRTSQADEWRRLWRRHDVEIDALEHDTRRPGQDQLVIRLHLFHLLQTWSPNTVGRDVGIPARGLHGEAYRGHVFWDELFILPQLSQRAPSLVRTHLLYRYYRLNPALRIARELGAAGACFPWQSASDGREATQTVHFNPVSGKWGPDFSSLQRHVNAAIVYDLWGYFEATGDRAFLDEYGAEVLLEIAKLWSSLARRNARTGRYDLAGVMGPDEFHERYPDSPAGGLRNNAYTNVMAAWCLARALEALEVVGETRRDELLTKLAIDAAELQRWDELTRLLSVPFHDGIISQFEGYEALPELDWAGYRARYGNVERIDRILKAEGSTPDRFKVSKQPDVIMLFYLFRPEEVRDLLARLGYPFDEDAVRRNVEYYEARTSHGSTLSKVVFTSVVHRMSCDQGCHLFLSALRSDLYDVQGGTTPEGIHLGAMAGTVDIMLRHYAGADVRRDGVHLSPDLPGRIHRLRFRLQFRGRWVDVELTPARARLRLQDSDSEDVPVELQGEWHQLSPGTALEVELRPAQKWGHVHAENALHG